MSGRGSNLEFRFSNNFSRRLSGKFVHIVELRFRDNFSSLRFDFRFVTRLGLIAMYGLDGFRNCFGFGNRRLGPQCGFAFAYLRLGRRAWSGDQIDSHAGDSRQQFQRLQIDRVWIGRCGIGIQHGHNFSAHY